MTFFVDKPFIYRHTLDMSAVDFTGHWQPGAVFRAMQLASNAHCIELHLTYEELLAQGLVWVLTRAAMEMDEYPMLDDEVEIHTWPTQNRHAFFPRHYTYHCHGREIGRSTALYVLMDVETRKIVPPTRLQAPVPSFDIKPPLPMPGNISMPDVEAALEAYVPVYTDFDMNSHVNNTRYVDLFMNRFPYERHQQEEIKALLIHYLAEIRHDEGLELHLWDKDGVSVLQGSCNGQGRFSILGEWRSR